jgi:hypothetical protein
MGKHFHNEIYFGDSIATFYQKNIETTFFNHYLKNPKSANLPEAYMFDTGKKSGNNLQNGHQKQLKNSVLLRENGKFTTENPSSAFLQNIFQTQINQFRVAKI